MLKIFLDFSAVLPYNILMKNRNTAWTERENRMLQDYYYTLGRRSMFDLFPGRNVLEIVDQVSFLKRKNRPFEEVCK